MQANRIEKVTLGGRIGMDEFIAVTRYGAQVEFSDEYIERVKSSRALLEKWVGEGRAIYGVTTGFGALSKKAVSKEDAALLQKNILLTHSTSVGVPLSEEQVRGTMLMVLQNMGQGYSGVRMEVLEYYRRFLNLSLTPVAPGEGSVGYLCPEAHIALALLGEGEAFFDGQRMPSREALKQVCLSPIELSYKEGLALISGTTGATALGALALFDMIACAKSADIIGAMSLEVLKGTTKAFDERLMGIRPQPEQEEAASNVRRILADSPMAQRYRDYRLQDALSLRCIPQLHGAARKTLNDALKVIEIEMNSCCDNPILWPEGGDGQAISGCNADSSYVGMEMDSACIAATALAKMSERRNNRLLDPASSGFPAFLAADPGINSGLMIPQYTQAGLLGEMRILSHPSCIDNTPTCANQEDYVAMGYNASKKAAAVAEKLQFILAIELLSVYTAHAFITEDKPGSVTYAILKEISKSVPRPGKDFYLYPHINTLKDFIRSRKIIDTAEELIGALS